MFYIFCFSPVTQISFSLSLYQSSTISGIEDTKLLTGPFLFLLKTFSVCITCDSFIQNFRKGKLDPQRIGYSPQLVTKVKSGWPLWTGPSSHRLASPCSSCVTSSHRSLLMAPTCVPWACVFTLTVKQRHLGLVIS